MWKICNTRISLLNNLVDHRQLWTKLRTVQGPDGHLGHPGGSVAHVGGPAHHQVRLPRHLAQQAAHRRRPGSVGNPGKTHLQGKHSLELGIWSMFTRPKFRFLFQNKGIEIWARPITPFSGDFFSYAIAFLNRRTDGTPSEVSVGLQVKLCSLFTEILQIFCKNPGIVSVRNFFKEIYDCI